MQMYDSISYNKDFINGDFVSEVKSKKDSGIKGKVNVSLYDAKSGELLKEAYTENLIPDLYFKEQFITSFLGGILGGGGSRYCNNYLWFEYLYLTDSDKPENVKEQRVSGNIIGYAHRNTSYAGSDTQRGTINLSETKFEITDSKIRTNFVFDFPTHSANGITESLYFCEAEPTYKDYFYLGPAVCGRETSDNSYSIASASNPKRYFGIYYGLGNSKNCEFTSQTKGFLILDCKSTSITQNSNIEFPEELKGHWVYFPFDVNVNDFLLYDQAVCLLNKDGDPLVAVSTDSVKKYDGLIYASPYGDNIIGYNTYSLNNESYIRIYKWSKVGVLLSYNDVNISQAFKDTANDVKFTYRNISGNCIYNDGLIDIVGYTVVTNKQYDENEYTSIWGQIDSSGNIVQSMNVKPKIGSSTWFNTKGMNSGNIQRRSYISNFNRSGSRVYVYYSGTQGGSSFWQCIDYSGNVIEPYRQSFSLYSASYTTLHNIVNTDKWIARYLSGNGSSCSFMIYNALTSRPIGTHTRLTQPIEKTEANTMKVQYMFEIDLLSFGDDYY